jgi:hypothetical protein
MVDGRRSSPTAPDPQSLVHPLDAGDGRQGVRDLRQPRFDDGGDDLPLGVDDDAYAAEGSAIQVGPRLYQAN